MRGIWFLTIGIVGCAAGTGPGSSAGPVAVITSGSVEGDWPLVVELSASESTGQSLVDWRWDMGDGETRSGTDVTYTYWGAGDYEIELTVEDDAGETGVDVLFASVGRPPCPEAGEPVALGVVGAEELWEISGVAESLEQSGVLYVHNDAGNATRLYAIDSSGATLAEWGLEEVSWGDWEDIAVSRNPETQTSYIYYGNIGDNAADKADITVWQIPAPDDNGGDADLRGSESVMQYPGGSRDAETLFVDPITDDIYVVQKDYDGAAAVYRKSAPHRDGDDVILEEVATLDFSVAPFSGSSTTGGDVSPDGTWIIIRTYRQDAYLWRRDRTRPLWEAFDKKPCDIRLPSEPQGESVAFSADGLGLWTVSEGANPTVNYTPLLVP